MALRDNIIRIIIICWSFMVTPVVTSSAQTSPFDPAVFGEAARIREHVDCYTDRSLYITGEVIRFRADVHCSGDLSGHEWSKVLYLELCAANGVREAYGKYPVNDGVSTGEIAIPAGILTGNYFLRCYTRWMRNRGPATYAYVPLRIVNPYRPELSMALPSEKATIRLSSQPGQTGSLEFSSPSPVYKRRDTISLDLLVSATGIRGPAEGCLTVVPPGTKPGVAMQITGPQIDTLPDFRVAFLPDLFGATLSGRVMKQGTEGQAVQDAGIHISLLGAQPDYLVTFSDALGKFSVSLPYREGNLKLLIQAQNPDTGKLEVRIDQDFDPRIIPVQTNPFHLTGKEKQLAATMARKVQLSRMYRQRDTIQQDTNVTAPVPFYGSPSFSLNMDDFILLPSLDEVFLNLVPGVSVVTRKKQTTLMIGSENPAFSVYDPLIMVDEVPVFDMARFMAVPTNRISRIDVINDIYLKGDVRFGGVINIQTGRRDMAGVDLPGNAVIAAFTAMYSPSSPSLLKVISGNDRIPDTRNTLLWIPRIKVSSENVSHVTFTAPDYPGEYLVLFRGRDMQGSLVYLKSSIRVE